MCAVYVMHGVVDSPDPARFVDRNLVDAQKFDQYLKRLPTRFVSLEQAMDGEGDALTIDDGIAAAARAAQIAWSHRHEVTLFVNGFNVEAQTPYWFSLLNLALDRTCCARFELAGSGFSLADTPGKKQFRNTVKNIVCSLQTEHERLDYIRLLAEKLAVADLDLPPDLQPLTRTRLGELINAGVRVQNHGWTHCHPGAMASRYVWRDIEQGKVWIRDRLDVESLNYAVPFGEVAPPDDPPAKLFEIWFLADSRFFSGRVGKRIYNRVTLKGTDIER